MDLSGLKTDAAGLVAVVVQDRHGGEVRMVGYANEEAVRRTLETKSAHFYSRSRQALWRKGETSGNFLLVSEVWVDCDADALIYLVDPHGPTCHTGERSCFFRRLDTDDYGHAAPTLAKLGEVLESRRRSVADKSYTKSLLEKGDAKIAQKIREEGGELATALNSESDDRVVSESADVLYHVIVGLMSRGCTLRDLEQALAERFGVSGYEEKAARKAVP
ncbi:MAG: bifunctional phosphoribosyl-AMP cyclohydrolase/phosphoribosyl-ATP diphosphatase HisIE [Myxococcota bacterium]